MNELYEFGSYEELMTHVIGVSDPSTEEFVSLLGKANGSYLFAYVGVDVREVRLTEYLGRSGIPLVFVTNVLDVNGEKIVRVLNDTDDMELTLVLRHSVSSSSKMSYFVDRRTGKFYYSLSDDDVTTVLEMLDVLTPRDLVDHLGSASNQDRIVYVESGMRNQAVRDRVVDAVEGDLHVKFLGDRMPLVLNSRSDFGGFVTTMGTVGMSDLATSFTYEGKSVGFELIAGHNNALGIGNDWFYEIVYNVYTNKVPLHSGYVLENVVELKKVNDTLAGVIFATYDAWEGLGAVETLDKHVDWFWVIPFTKRELGVMKKQGIQGLFDDWARTSPDVFDLSRRDKRFKFF